MILTETQNKRDLELSNLTGVPLKYVKKLEIKSKQAITIYNGSFEVESEEDYINLYKKYKCVSYVAHLRTVMFTSVHSRHKDLFRLIKATKNKECLDFGSGVGTHTIALLEQGNSVSMLDVPGPLFSFALRRIWNRGFEITNLYNHNSLLPNSNFDVVICTDVLEHVFDPIRELKKITNCLKPLGKLHLQVSNKIKPSSGHFKQSVLKWRENGPQFLKEHYIKISEKNYQKKG